MSSQLKQAELTVTQQALPPLNEIQIQIQLSVKCCSIRFIPNTFETLIVINAQRFIWGHLCITKATFLHSVRTALNLKSVPLHHHYLKALSFHFL